MIAAENLNVELGGKPILSNVKFAAQAGNVTAIIGPNGSGKTTLLRTLCGELPYTGSAKIAGTELCGMSALELAQKRAVLSQFSGVAFPYTVAEVVSLGIAVFNPGTNAIDQGKKVSQALERVGLRDFATRRYHELSGGEQQRVQLARVLCQVWEPTENGQPKWLFLDEPVSSLDIQHQLTIMEIAKTFAQGGGGVVTIMHDLNLTVMYAHQIVLMKNGSVLGAGTPKQVMKNKTLSEAFDCDLKVGIAPAKGEPYLLPQSVNL